MKRYTLSLFALSFFLCLVTSAGAQPDSCEGRLLSYQPGNTAGTGVYELAAAGGGGRLLYYGAIHSSQVADTQFTNIKAAWDKFEPTLAFYEGPDRGVASSDTATIAKLGESGYVRFLARQKGIPARTLEDPAGEYDAVAAVHGEAKTELFYILREAQRLSRRNGMDSTAVAAQTERLLQRMSAMRTNGLPFTSVSAIDSAYRSYWHTGEWWHASAEWFEPGKEDSLTGGLFTNTINTTSSQYRDRAMYRMVTEAVRRGERVFVVVGKDHVPHQMPAIRCRLGL